MKGNDSIGLMKLFLAFFMKASQSITDGRTDRRTDQRTVGHTLLYRCEDASKKGSNSMPHRLGPRLPRSVARLSVAFQSLHRTSEGETTTHGQRQTPSLTFILLVANASATPRPRVETPPVYRFEAIAFGFLHLLAL